MIQIRKGTTRIVFILFSYLVIKIANPRFDLLKRKFASRTSIDQFAREALRSLYFHTIYGISANVSEGLIFALIGRKALHLTPIYTLGIVNISFYEGSRRPCRAEIDAFYQSLSDESRDMLMKCDSHAKASGNWRKTRRGLRLIDYGIDPLTAPWALFIRYQHEELHMATIEASKSTFHCAECTK
jgi:hypothetical protein